MNKVKKGKSFFGKKNRTKSKNICDEGLNCPKVENYPLKKERGPSGGTKPERKGRHVGRH